MVLLTMLSASCYAHASTNRDTWPKKLSAHFNQPDIWKSCVTSFWSPWCMECNGITDDFISITWCWCQHQWHHMIREVMLHLILIVLTQKMNYAVDSAIWHQVSLVVMVLYDQPEQSYCSSFWLSRSWKSNISTGDVISIMWCWHWE